MSFALGGKATQKQQFILLLPCNLFQNDELLALLGAARRASDRDWLMILVAYCHGLRASEVTAIQQHDVADGYLTVRRLKGSLKTVQPLIEHKVALLNERRPFENFVAAMRPNQKVFSIGRVWFWRLVQRYAREARIPRRKAHPHALKHSIASHTIGLAGIENVRQWLGHKSIGSTGAYLRVTDDQAADAIRTAVRSI